MKTICYRFVNALLLFDGSPFVELNWMTPLATVFDVKRRVEDRARAAIGGGP